MSQGSTVITPLFFFQITVNASGVTVTKAGSFNGTQNPVVFPIPMAQARELAVYLIGLVG